MPKECIRPCLSLGIYFSIFYESHTFQMNLYTLGTESAHLYQYLPRQKKLIYLGLLVLHSYTCCYEKKKFLGTLDTFNGQKGQIRVTWLNA